MTPHIDTPAASIARRMLDGRIAELTADERSDFTRFLLSLRARHPHAVALVREKGQEAVVAALARDPEEYLAAKAPSSPATLVEWTERNAPSLIPNFGISIMHGVITDARTGKHVFGMPWWTRQVGDAKTDLLLSDRPCLLEGDAVAGECVIALPLSPAMLFFACNRERQARAFRSMSATRLVKEINRASVGYAADRIYGTGTQHLPLVDKYLGR